MVYAFSAFIKILFSKPSINIFFTQPPLFLIFAAWASRMRNVRYGIHAMDLYPDLLKELSYLRGDGIIYKWLHSMMADALQKAEFVAVLGSCMHRRILEYGVSEDKIKIVRNIPTVSQDDRPSESFLRKHGIKKPFVVLYAGNMGSAHEFGTILKVSQILEEKHKDIHFAFVGKGRRRHEIETFIEKYSPDNLTLFASLSNEDFYDVLNEASVHYISLRESFKGVMVPSKFYSSVAMGKAVIYEGASDSEIAEEIIKHKLGYNLDHLDSSHLEKLIVELYKNPQDLIQMGQNAKRYFQIHCNSDDIISDYGSFLKLQVQHSY